MEPTPFGGRSGAYRALTGKGAVLLNIEN